MENQLTTSSFLRNTEAGNRTSLVQHLNIPEPANLLFAVCKKPLAELSRITVTELRVNESAKGFYLLLRTLEPSVTVVVNGDFGPTAVVQVEDHDKNRIACCLYGHVHLKSVTELKQLLPVHTVLVLKEPFLVACGEQHFAVVVGSPSDFVVVGRSHVLFVDAEALGWREETEEEGFRLISKWRRIGDDLFQNGKFEDASQAYVFALNNCWDKYTRLLININLAKCFLALDCYESAVKHAQNVLEMEPFNVSALFCIGRAHYELRGYAKAKFYFKALKHASPTCKNVLTELACCEERLAEAEGNVDIYKLYRSSLTDVTTLNDHGNFTRNIEFRSGPDNERGVFATQDMEPGTLILVEKAIVSIFESRFSSELGVVKFMRTSFTVALKNPKTFGLKLHYLPGGCKLDGSRRRIFCDEVNESEPIVDVFLLHKIMLKNMLQTKDSVVPNAPIADQAYVIASRFRHSCLSNCTLLVYKDVITVRTCTTVLKGEELFVRFYGNHLSFPEKQKAFERSGFTCSCSLCALDELESTEVHDLRQELKSRFYMLMALGAGDILFAEERLLPIVNELQMTYKNRVSLRLILFIVYRHLAKAVDRSQEDWKDKLTLYVELGLDCVGLSTEVLLKCVEEFDPKISIFVLMPSALFDYAGLMAEKEHFSGRLELARQWIKVLFLLERFFRGGNFEMLLKRCSHFKNVPSLLSMFAK